MAGDVDLERFRLLGSGVKPTGKRKPTKKARSAAPFIRGPLPLAWFVQAAHIPRRNALIVGLVLWYLAGLRGERVGLVLCVSRFKPFGIGRKAVERGLRDLETASLIHVERVSGRCARVDLID